MNDKYIRSDWHVVMEIQGTVHNGVIVLDAGTQLPEGTSVTVIPRESVSRPDLTVAREALRRIAELPVEGLTDPFSGSQHDQALYGKAP